MHLFRGMRRKKNVMTLSLPLSKVKEIPDEIFSANSPTSQRRAFEQQNPTVLTMTVYDVRKLMWEAENDGTHLENSDRKAGNFHVPKFLAGLYVAGEGFTARY